MIKQKFYFVISAIAVFASTIGVLFSILRLPFLPAVNIISPINSFKILANHMFTISEQYQAYLYRHFTVTVSPLNYENYLFVALLLIAILLALLIVAAYKIKVIYAIILFTFTALQIYFGVFAAPVWNIVLYAATAWVALRNANFAFLSGAVIVTALAAVLFFPGQSPFLTQVSEAIRDQFGQQQERQVVMDTAPHEHIQQNETAQIDITDDDLIGGQGLYIYHDYDEMFAGSQIGTAFGQRLWILWLIGFAFAIGFVIWFLQKLLAAFKRQALFNSQDYHIAVDAMFKHMIVCVTYFSAKPKNMAYTQYATYFPQETGYLSILDIWQRATYSNHKITADDKQQMRTFLDDTLTLLVKKKNPIARAIVRTKLFFSSSVIPGSRHSNLGARTC